MPSLPSPLWTGVGSNLIRALSMSQTELNCGFESLLFLHLNRMVLILKLHTELLEIELFWHLNCNYWNKTIFTFNSVYCPVGWGCKIRQLHFYRGVKKKTSVLDITPKQSDDEVPVMLELWGMQSTPSLPLLPGPRWPRVVALIRALFMD